MVSVSGQGVDLLIRGNSRPAGHCASLPKTGELKAVAHGLHRQADCLEVGALVVKGGL